MAADNQNLHETLLQRQLGAQQPALPAPTGLPAPTPNPKSNLPPAWKRYATGLKMQHAYANGWNPNPMLLRILEGGK